MTGAWKSSKGRKASAGTSLGTASFIARHRGGGSGGRDSRDAKTTTKQPARAHRMPCPRAAGSGPALPAATSKLQLAVPSTSHSQAHTPAENPKIRTEVTAGRLYKAPVC
jgi:hypothetical protein